MQSAAFQVALFRALEIRDKQNKWEEMRAAADRRWRAARAAGIVVEDPLPAPPTSHPDQALIERCARAWRRWEPRIVERKKVHTGPSVDEILREAGITWDGGRALYREYEHAIQAHLGRTAHDPEPDLERERARQRKRDSRLARMEQDMQEAARASTAYPDLARERAASLERQGVRA